MGIFGKLKPFRTNKKQHEDDNAEFVAAQPSEATTTTTLSTSQNKAAAQHGDDELEATTTTSLYRTTTSTSQASHHYYPTTTNSMMMMNNNSGIMDDHHHHQHQHSGPEPDEISIASGASGENQIRAWDEGGSSDCGYSETLHHMFMCVGGGVHKLVGSPSDSVHAVQKTIGNWFQELSYATRDILRGEGGEGMQEDAIKAAGTFVLGGGEDYNNDPAADGVVVLGSTSSTAAAASSSLVPQEVQ
jgi:hypothetical protein